ncbi:MAG: DUF3180 domain-containing protein [Corynebacterium sp.]|nr:DUF3180 domain-containing protein [Corynebacterium sp.]
MMSKTSMRYPLVTSLYILFIAGVLTYRFYGSLASLTFAPAIISWLLVVLCVVMGIIIRNRIKDNKVGMDRSQFNPIYGAFWYALSSACIWGGAILGGLYAGLCTYIVPHLGTLVAAQDDAPAAIATAIGGYALLAAALFLERCCQVPPQSPGEVA